MKKELDAIDLSTQRLYSQFGNNNTDFTATERKNIQISSNIHALKLHTTDVIAKIEFLKRKMPKEVESPTPKYIVDLEKELDDMRKKRATTLELINEMHNEGICQIDSVQSKTTKEKKMLEKRYQELVQEKQQNRELISNVNLEFQEIASKLENEINEYRSKPFSQSLELVISIKNELESVDEQITSLERESEERRSKLDEMGDISTKMLRFIEEKKNVTHEIISSTKSVIEKTKSKIVKLKELLHKQNQINEELVKEESKYKSAKNMQRVDYVSIYKSEKVEQDEKYSQMTKNEERKNKKIVKKTAEYTDHIQYARGICESNKNTVDEMENAKMKLMVKIDQLKKKGVLIDQAINQARNDLESMKQIEEADRLSTNTAKIVPVHVQTYAKLPKSNLCLEMEIKRKYKTLFDQVENAKNEYKVLVSKEKMINNWIPKTQHENDCLKKYLAPYPKLKRFFNKYIKKRRQNQPNITSPRNIQQNTTGTSPRMTLECNQLSIQAL